MLFTINFSQEKFYHENAYPEKVFMILSLKVNEKQLKQPFCLCCEYKKNILKIVVQKIIFKVALS